MSKLRSWTICFAGLALLSGIAFAAKIKSDFDKTTDFSVYKTYSWGENSKPNRPAAEIVIIAAINHELETLGLRLVGVDEADLIVRYQAAGDADMNFSAAADPTYAAFGGIPVPGATVWTSGVGGGSSGRYVRKGALIIDVFDRQQHKLVWSATATDAVHDNAEKAIKQVSKIITDMFTYYPSRKNNSGPSGK
jgi:Domain of unknown function (DUF4136)